MTRIWIGSADAGGSPLSLPRVLLMTAFASGGFPTSRSRPSRCRRVTLLRRYAPERLRGHDRCPDPERTVRINSRQGCPHRPSCPFEVATATAARSPDHAAERRPPPALGYANEAFGGCSSGGTSPC